MKDSPSEAECMGLSCEGLGQVQGKDQVVTVRVSQLGLIMTDKFP